jgi:hypothetical protein
MPDHASNLLKNDETRNKLPNFAVSKLFVYNQLNKHKSYEQTSHYPNLQKHVPHSDGGSGYTGRKHRLQKQEKTGTRAGCC